MKLELTVLTMTISSLMGWAKVWKANPGADGWRGEVGERDEC